MLEVRRWLAGSTTTCPSAAAPEGACDSATAAVEELGLWGRRMPQGSEWSRGKRSPLGSSWEPKPPPSWEVPPAAPNPPARDRKRPSRSAATGG